MIRRRPHHILQTTAIDGFGAEFKPTPIVPSTSKLHVFQANPAVKFAAEKSNL
jgi:hypothetical protein